MLIQEFKHIIFIESTHEYKNVNTLEKYRSTTNFISSLFDKFDSDFWSVYKHLQRIGYRVYRQDTIIFINNRPIDYRDYIADSQYIRDEWKSKSTASTDRGTAIHRWLEYAFANKFVNIDYNLTGAKKYYRDNRDKHPIYSECIVADDEFKLAGQIDRPFLVGENLLDLVDYKTNEKIDFENKYEQGYNNLDNCSFNKYMLQLNFYRYMLEKNTKYRVRNMEIAHITDNDYEIISIPKYNIDDILRSTVNN